MAETKTSGLWLSGRTYDFLKFVAQILLPALGTLYASVAGLWGLPAVLQVVGTIVAVDTFLGVVLGISSAQYKASDAKYDGILEVLQHDHENGALQIHLQKHPSEFADMKSVTFKVDSNPTEVPTSTPGDLPPVPPV